MRALSADALLASTSADDVTRYSIVNPLPVIGALTLWYLKLHIALPDVFAFRTTFLLMTGNFSFSLATARQLYLKNKSLRRAQTLTTEDEGCDNQTRGSKSNSSETSSLASVAGDEAQYSPARRFLRLPADVDSAGIQLICTSFDTNEELHEK